MHYNYQRTYEKILMNERTHRHTHTFTRCSISHRELQKNFIKNKVTHSQPQDHTKQIFSNYLQIPEGEKISS